MAGSPGGQGTPDPPDADPTWSWSPPPTAVPPSHPPTAVPPTAVPPTAVPPTTVPPTHSPTQPSSGSGTAPASPATETVTGSPQPVPWWREGSEPQSKSPAWWPASSARPAEIVRHGPGVPAAAPVSQAVPVSQSGPTAEQVWRTGLPEGSDYRPKKPLYRRVIGPAITAILLIASLVVIYTRLHHPAFGVTGVAITQQVKNGCTTDVTGRIGITGGAGTVSYQWVFQPQLETPQPLSQTVVAGQTSVYVTAAVEGQGHGTQTQTATLEVLGPGRDSASARIVVSC